MKTEDHSLSALIVKEDGLIYVNRVSEEPQVCMSYVLGHCLLMACRCHDEQKAYERMIASAKESAIKCADQEQATERLIKSGVCVSMEINKPLIAPGIYPIPDLQWEEGIEPMGADFPEFVKAGKVAILKESTPSTEQETFKGCSPTACGCKSLADCPNNQPQITVMGQGFRFKKFSLIQENPRTVATDRTKIAEQESQEKIWREIYIDFKDGEGWINFAKRMNERFTITRRKP